jgi:hypothetical protein
MLLAVRRAVDGETDDSYVSTLLERLLMTLGIESGEARRIASAAVST